MSYDACLPVRLMVMQNISGITFGILTVTSHSQALEFPLIIISASARCTGVYCFKAHGQIYHRLDQLVPRGRGPRHMQLYFYDTNETPLRIGPKGCLSLILQ